MESSCLVFFLCNISYVLGLTGMHECNMNGIKRNQKTNKESVIRNIKLHNRCNDLSMHASNNICNMRGEMQQSERTLKQSCTSGNRPALYRQMEKKCKI